jgi:hypothetical protein
VKLPAGSFFVFSAKKMAFFWREDLEMYHIKSDHLVCSGESA